MHSINLPDDQFQQLTVVAQAAGYADVPSMLGALADEATKDPRGPLSDDELSKSVAMIQRGDAEVEAGGGLDAEDAFRALGEKHGFKLP